MDTIHLQVEMDILSMSYTSPENESGLACIIFKVCLNRHADWANNYSKWSPPSFITADNHFHRQYMAWRYWCDFWQQQWALGPRSVWGPDWISHILFFGWKWSLWGFVSSTITYFPPFYSPPKLLELRTSGQSGRTLETQHPCNITSPHSFFHFHTKYQAWRLCCAFQGPFLFQFGEVASWAVVQWWSCEHWDTVSFQFGNTTLF